ncbi:MAG: hypothetical protein KDA85_02520 [Planctomycetaceae bacterium]|nr:hypothetical protein [Planctomycetaceae bacterium]
MTAGFSRFSGVNGITLTQHAPTSPCLHGTLRLRWWLLLLGLMVGTGCAISRPVATVGPGGFQVSAEHRDLVWERAVSVLNRFHFMVMRESKLEGLIETDYRAGANILEPWHPDATSLESRLESTLQSIRRRAVVSIQSAGPGLLNVTVRVDKEIEDVPAPAATYEGGATFSDAQPLERDLNQVLGQSGPSRWLSQGRDLQLEHEILRAIRSSLAP